MPSSGGKSKTKMRKASGPKNPIKERLERVESAQRKGIDFFAQDLHQLFENQRAFLVALEDFDLTLAAFITVSEKHGVTREELSAAKEAALRERQALVEKQEVDAKKLLEEGEILKTVQRVAAEGGTPVFPPEAFVFGGQ